MTYTSTIVTVSLSELRDVLVTICDEKDNYRFGFNGQEKVNEINGIGNHNTALFWEYDTRLGWRWNLDPVVNPSESPYAVFNGSPIWKNDELGDQGQVPMYSNPMAAFAEGWGQYTRAALSFFDNISWGTETKVTTPVKRTGGTTISTVAVKKTTNSFSLISMYDQIHRAGSRPVSRRLNSITKCNRV